MEVMFLQRPEGSEHSPLGSSFSTPPPPPPSTPRACPHLL